MDYTSKAHLCGKLYEALEAWERGYSREGAGKPSKEMELVKLKVREALMWLREDDDIEMARRQAHEWTKE